MQIRLTSTEAQLIVDVLREYATPEREALASRILHESHKGKAADMTGIDPAEEFLTNDTHTSGKPVGN